MKRLIFAVMMLLLSTEFVLAAAPKPQCGEFEQVIEFLTGLDYQPLMGAANKDGNRISLFFNDTGFVVVENLKDKKLCILFSATTNLRVDKDAAFGLLGLAGAVRT